MVGALSARASRTSPPPAVTSPVTATAAARIAPGSHRGSRSRHSAGRPQPRSTPTAPAAPATSPPPSIAAHGATATSAVPGISALPSTATVACAPATLASTGPASARSRPPSRRTAQRAPVATTTMTPAVGNSGSTLNGCPSITSGIWCAANHSGMVAANAASSGIPTGSTAAAADGTSRA